MKNQQWLPKVPKFQTVAFITCLLIGSLVASNAQASHLWTFVDASCNASTNTIDFTMYHEPDGSTDSGLWIDFSVDGNFVEQVQFFGDGNALPEDNYDLSHSSPSFSDGVEVELNSGNDIITVICAGQSVPPIAVSTLTPSGILLMLLMFSLIGILQLQRSRI